jgi:hypothetical protein
LNLWEWMAAPFRPKVLPPAAAFPERAMAALQTAQARPSWWNTTSPFGNPYAFIPQGQDLLLYEQLVSTVPVLNAALTKTVELIGTARFEHADDAVEAELKDWLARVRVNRTQHGFANWQNTWMIDHLTYGRAHAELIPTVGSRDLGAIQELHPRTIAFRPTPGIYDVEIVQWQTGKGDQVTLNPATLITAIYDARTDNPYGSSLLFGLPFVAEIMSAMMLNLGETWKRYGTPAYWGNWKPPENFNDPKGEISEGVKSSILAGLRDVQIRRSKGDIADFVTTGDVTLAVLGAQGEILEFTLPFRSICEQVVAKTGLPPMMLGLQWQAGERIGADQAKLLSARIDAIRQALEPELLYVVQLRQALAGQPMDVQLCWNAPTLIDAVETAQGELWQAQAEKLEQGNDENLWRLGVIGAPEYARRHREDLKDMKNEEVVAALAAEGLTLPAEPPALPAPQPFGGGAGAGSGNGNGNAPNRPQRSLTYGNGRH